MGSAVTQGELWSIGAQDWAALQEPKHRPLWDAMLDAAEVRQGTRFLDAGCGGGGASVLAAERGAQISGLDAAASLINIAGERVPGGDFRVGDIEDLPFPDDAFDAVFAANAVQYAADRPAAMRELRRVCAAGGRVVAGLFGPQEKVAYRIVQKAVRDALPEPPAGAGPYELSGPGKLESLFEKAGLRVLDSGEVDCPFDFPDIETFWRGQVSAGPFQRALRAVGEARLKAAVAEAIDGFRRDDGSILIQPNIFKYVVAAL